MEVATTAEDEEWTILYTHAAVSWGHCGGWGHPRDYSDFKGLVFGICRRHKRTATLNWMSFGFIDFTIAATIPRVLLFAGTACFSPRSLASSFSISFPLSLSSTFPLFTLSITVSLPSPFVVGLSACISPLSRTLRPVGRQRRPLSSQRSAGGLFHLHNAHTLPPSSSFCRSSMPATLISAGPLTRCSTRT